MIMLFKNHASTLNGVLKNAKHASNGKPKNIQPGDVILIAQTKGSLLPDEKPIRWIMNFVRTYEDSDNESVKIWGKKWRYIIQGENVRSVEPFDIEDLKISNKDYNSVQTFCDLDSEDEKEVMKWIQEENEIKIDESEDVSEEFEDNKNINYDELIKKLDEKYSGKPEYEERVVKYIQRPSALRKAILKKEGYVCKICGCDGFLKKGGNKYAETHHMKELNENAPDTLQSWNVLVVCPTCHKKLHYADVKTEFLNPGWKIIINKEEIIIK